MCPIERKCSLNVIHTDRLRQVQYQKNLPQKGSAGTFLQLSGARRIQTFAPQPWADASGLADANLDVECADLVQWATRHFKGTWVWVKIKLPGTAGFSPCFHLPRVHLGYRFLTHSHLVFWTRPKLENRLRPPPAARARQAHRPQPESAGRQPRVIHHFIGSLAQRVGSFRVPFDKILLKACPFGLRRLELAQAKNMF